MKRSSSSNRWLQEHFADQYVKRAQREGLRARSAYKLIEINQSHRLIKAGMAVVDLGAAPGGWSEYVARIVGSQGKVLALDLLPMRPIGGVTFIQGDFTDSQVVSNLEQQLAGRLVELILSDMAPNLSGVKAVDHLRSMELATQVILFARRTLGNGGSLLMKIFHGADFDQLTTDLRKKFSEVKVVKPSASRSRSSEVFLLARNFRENFGDLREVK